jgi:hypothetical protein
MAIDSFYKYKLLMFKLLFKINLKQMYLHHDFLTAHGLIAHGPDKAIGIDEDNCLVLAFFSFYHCTMEVEYAWYRDGVPLKQGRKSCLLFVNEPGQYHCVVKVNDNIKQSEGLIIEAEMPSVSVDMTKHDEIGNNHSIVTHIVTKLFAI